MKVLLRFRDTIRRMVTPWLSERPAKVGAPKTDGKSVGYRLLWSMIAPLDAAADVAMQALQAPWPDVGTPTAQPLIGRSRGILRGQGETDAAYGLRLRSWLDTWREAGSQRAIAKAVHTYLAGHPRVRVVSRSGVWTTVEADGSITTASASWDWDSVSHPERAGHSWDQWVIVYPSPWAVTVAGPRSLGDDVGLGHASSAVEYDAILGEIARWRSAHSYVRAVIWTSDETLFDPAVPASCPDGTWGAWGGRGSGSRTVSGRRTDSCRYWEPR